jgi:hypothetical protein
MLLTDPAVQYWSCVIAALVTFAVLMLWNRVRGPRAVRGLSRFGLLVGGYFATAVAVLVSVNIAYGGLIVSVDDLFADLNPPMGHGHHKHGPCAAAVPGNGAPAATAEATSEAAPGAAAGAGAGAAADGAAPQARGAVLDVPGATPCAPAALSAASAGAGPAAAGQDAAGQRVQP